MRKLKLFPKLNLPKLCCLGTSSSSGKASVLAKKSSAVLLTELQNGSQDGEAVGIILRKNLVLTSHAAIPSPYSAEAGEMSLSYSASSCCPSQTTVKQKLRPAKNFATNPAFDISVVACDEVPAAVPLSSDLSKGAKGPLGAESKVYILGALHGSKPSSAKNFTVGEARVTTENESVVRFTTTNGETWLPGSAGFNDRGDFAFIVCQPQRQCKSASSSSGCSKSVVKQSGVTRREILHWIDPSPAEKTASPRSEDPRSPSRRPPEDQAQRVEVERLSSAPPHYHHHHHHPHHHHHLPHHHNLHHHHLNLRTELPEHELDIVLPCPYVDSPRSCSSGLNPRQPGVSYPATPSTKSSPRSSPCRRRTSSNPRLVGVSYSVSPTRSVTSARSRMSSQSVMSGGSVRSGRSSRRASPCSYRLPSPCSSSARRSSPLVSSCCLGGGSPRKRYEEDDKFQEFLNSPEFEPPPFPHSGSSSEEEASAMDYSRSSAAAASQRGRPRSVAATRKQIFKGPSCRPVRAKVCGGHDDQSSASDGEVYLGVGYMKHTHVSRNKASQKVGLPGYTIWHH